MVSGGLQSDQEIGNLVEQIKELQERMTQLETHALTSQNILANKIAVGDVDLALVDDGGIRAHGGIFAGIGNGYAAMGINGVSTAQSDLVFYSSGEIQGIIRRDSDGDLKWMRYNPAGTGQGESLTLDSSDGDIWSKYAWTDWAASSTIVGWSSFTTKKLYFKRIGRFCWIQFAFDGTSNSTSTNFSLPFQIASGQPHPTIVAQIKNAGTFAVGLVQSNTPPTATMIAYSTVLGGGWTASGIKTIIGQFFYQIT